MCKVHIFFKFSTLIFVIAEFDFRFPILKIKVQIFVQNILKIAAKFSCKSLVKMEKILYNVYIVNNNGSELIFTVHLNVQVPL